MNLNSTQTIRRAKIYVILHIIYAIPEITCYSYVMFLEVAMTTSKKNILIHI